jgi:hypothetical protein
LRCGCTWQEAYVLAQKKTKQMQQAEKINFSVLLRKAYIKG